MKKYQAAITLIVDIMASDEDDASKMALEQQAVISDVVKPTGIVVDNIEVATVYETVIPKDMQSYYFTFEAEDGMADKEIIAANAEDATKALMAYFPDDVGADGYYMVGDDGIEYPIEW